MTTQLLLYLIKANIIITALWLFCRLLLGRDIRFRRKRLIINCGIPLALLLPLLSMLPSAHTAEAFAENNSFQSIQQAIVSATEFHVPSSADTDPHINVSKRVTIMSSLLMNLQLTQRIALSINSVC